MNDLGLPDRPVLLDGGMGRELRFRSVQISPHIWSASALVTAPDVVREVHVKYILAGADIITTNTYGVIRCNLAKEGIEGRFAELNLLACSLAREALDTTNRRILIAGSLPPLHGSYRPDLVGEFEEIEPLYREQAEMLAPHVDLLLCETMSTALEARAAASAACATGKPVWVSWTLHEDQSGSLRSGESIADAVAALRDLQVTGFLANCSAPERITSAVPRLLEAGADRTGGYANTLNPIPTTWKLSGKEKTDGVIALRSDLDPAQYAQHVSNWVSAGANVIGGCCGTRPAHIATLYDQFIRHDCGPSTEFGPIGPMI